MEATSNVAQLAQRAFGETKQKAGIITDSEAKVSLTSLSAMTGFPVDFIKTELLVKEDELSMVDLRKSMASYLENANKEMIN